MVDIFEKFRDELSKSDSGLEKVVSTDDLPLLVLFYSYDLVNSTLYKTLDNSWSKAFFSFFEIIRNESRRQSKDQIRVWKYVGDEVLLYQIVRSRKDILEAAKIAFSVMNKGLEKLRELGSQQRKTLSIKATLWIAKVKKVHFDDLESNSSDRNIMIYVNKEDQDYAEIDFLGHDIDIGFRISKLSKKNKLVVSADFACLAHKVLKDEGYNEDHSSQLSNFKVVDYEQIKGVWGGRYYPIVWYDDRWKNIDKMFSFDEKFTNPIVDKISKEEIEDIGNLDRVYQDMDLQTEIDELIEMLEQEGIKNYENKERRSKIPFERQAELHCSVLCFSKNRKVLIAKRSASKKRFADDWEFGCVQLGTDQTVEEAIITGYKQEFGVAFTDEKEFKPFLTYSFKGDGRTIPGIRFMAKIKTPLATIKKHFNTDKHSEVRFISETEIDTFQDGHIDGFKDALKLAFKLYDTFWGAQTN